ncbi:MAG: pentapeptide repeat-containing protein, partial [Oscillospiraceae bacterium]
HAGIHEKIINGEKYMSVIEPRIPQNAEMSDETFTDCAQRSMYDERAIFGMRFCDRSAERSEFSRLEIKNSSFENCAFTDCSFERASFTDVLFVGCNLSNSKFTDAYFERCRFVSCKCVGSAISGAVLKNITILNSNFRYACFDESKLTGIFIDGADFTEASVSGAVLKKFAARDSRFVKNNFFKTMLAGIDFTSCEFSAPFMSNPPAELSGAKVNMIQAAGLIGLLGVIVEL